MFSITKIEEAIEHARDTLTRFDLDNKLLVLEKYRLFVTKSLNSNWRDQDLNYNFQFYTQSLDILTDLLDDHPFDHAQLVVSREGEPVLFVFFEIGRYKFVCKHLLKYPGPSIFFGIPKEKNYSDFFVLVNSMSFCDDENRFILPFSLKPKTFVDLRNFVNIQLAGLPDPMINHNMCIPISDANIAYLDGLKFKD
jgi:hypothetical protein